MNPKCCLLLAAGACVGCYRLRAVEGDDDTANYLPEDEPEQAEYPRAGALHAGPGVVCGPDGGSCVEVEDCDGSWAPGPLAPPWWETDPPEQCVQHPAHDLLEYLDECQGNGSPGYEVCGAGIGDAVCAGTVTTLCRTSADCPPGLACSEGGEIVEVRSIDPPAHCAKRCDPAEGPAACVRCDYECSGQGVCMPQVVHNPPY